jgi:Flp pilus assembly protein TadD
MTHTRYRPWAFARLFLVLVALAHGISSALADGADVYSDSSGRFDSTQTLIDSGDYAGAVTELQQLLTETPDDADILNLLGFSHRKQGMFDEALEYYGRALEIDPEHRGALEYLGELYLQTDRPEMAEEQLARLNDLCTFCRERRELRKAIEEYRKSKG